MKNHIQHLVTRGHAPVAERAIRTIKDLIYRRMDKSPDSQWTDPKILSNALVVYNHRMPSITSYHDYNIPFFKAPIYIAHYVIQSKESYIRRKYNKPRDDSGTFRDKNDINNIHLLHNSVDNLQPKIQYENKIGEFFNRLLTKPIQSISLEDPLPTEDTPDFIDLENTLNGNDGRISEIHNS